jgi:hypothetical protein
MQQQRHIVRNPAGGQGIKGPGDDPFATRDSEH